MLKKSVLFSVFLLGISIYSKSEIPVGYYYLADGKQKSDLKTALHEIISQAKMYSYGSGDKQTTWNGFYQTDRNEDNSVIDMYSNERRYFTTQYSSVAGMHIEHSLPKSWWGSINNNAYKDLFHLYPADGTANSTKNNLPLGETDNPTFDNGKSKIGINSFGSYYTERCFEPADEYKGDFARSYFYMVTAYEDFADLWNSPMMQNNTYPVWQPWARELLLEWHRNDAVSEKELARIEAVYNIQGNRNPFIDYPDLVEYIWGNDTLNTYFFPTETRPFLLTPNRWTKLDFDVLLKNNTKQVSFMLKGVNITSNVVLTLKNGTVGFSLSQTSVLPNDITQGKQIVVEFEGAKVGHFTDTLLVSGGGLTSVLSVPMTVRVSSHFLTLQPTDVTPVSAELHWMQYPNATDYLLDFYTGDVQAGDLFFSTYIEGSGWNKSVEIYNGTAESIDLSNYSIAKQSDGVGDFGNEYRLSGIIDQGKTFAIVHGSADPALLALAQDTTTTDYKDILAFNGNDALALFHSGILIDAIGYKDSTNFWGENLTLVRKAKITHPSSEYIAEQWDTLGIDNWSVLGTHAATFAGSSNYILQQYSTGTNNSYRISDLEPDEIYSYRVTAVTDIAENSRNSVHLNTLPFSAPLALEATEVSDTSFVANWESYTYAQSYLLDVFTVSGNAPVVLTESFDDIGTNGKPLPNGWSGNISGAYTSSSNSGNAIPSAAFKNDGEYLQTPIYDGVVTKLSFMGKFVSGNEGSNLIISALYDETWKPVDTIFWKNNTKSYPEYIFSEVDNVSSVRFIYNKVSGNYAIDDISITYGKQEKTYVLKQQLVSGESYLVSGLLPQTTYNYTLKSAYSTTKISPASNQITVATTKTQPSALPANTVPEQLPKVWVENRRLHIDSDANTLVFIYDMQGKMILSTSASEAMRFVFRNGIYWVSIDGSATSVCIW